MPKFTCMNKECDNHAFGCSGNCRFETVAFNKNGDCLQFESKFDKSNKIKKCTLGMFNPASMKDRYLTEKLDEIIDAVNELGQANKLTIDNSGICPLCEMFNNHCTKCLRNSFCLWFNQAKEAGLIDV